MTAIKADPALALQFKMAVMANDADLEKAYLADRKDARAMQTAALDHEDKFSKRFVYIFASAWSLFTMVYFGCVTFIEVPIGGQRVSDTILGVLIGSVLGSIFQFFYGTNRGSQIKDATISNLSK
jgi:hypothetical protein